MSGSLSLQAMTDTECSYQEIESSLNNSFDIASPELLASRSLLRRTDTKFVISLATLLPLLKQLQDDYSIVLANGKTLADYRTLYFDSKSLQCFHDHRRGRRPRYKVRIRHYTDRQVSFLELKCKQNESITVKHRWKKSHGCNVIEPCEFARLKQARPDLDALHPQLWTNFKRATLVSTVASERVTIDTLLQFQNDKNSHSLGPLTIVEVKQSPFKNQTPIMKLLRAAGCYPSSASKYCMASIFLDRSLRHNRLRPTLRLWETIQ